MMAGPIEYIGREKQKIQSVWAPVWQRANRLMELMSDKYGWRVNPEKVRQFMQSESWNLPNQLPDRNQAAEAVMAMIQAVYAAKKRKNLSVKIGIAGGAALSATIVGALALHLLSQPKTPEVSSEAPVAAETTPTPIRTAEKSPVVTELVKPTQASTTEAVKPTPEAPEMQAWQRDILNKHPDLNRILGQWTIASEAGISSDWPDCPYTELPSRNNLWDFLHKYDTMKGQDQLVYRYENNHTQYQLQIKTHKDGDNLSITIEGDHGMPTNPYLLFEQGKVIIPVNRTQEQVIGEGDFAVMVVYFRYRWAVIGYDGQTVRAAIFHE